MKLRPGNYGVSTSLTQPGNNYGQSDQPLTLDSRDGFILPGFLVKDIATGSNMAHVNNLEVLLLLELLLPGRYLQHGDVQNQD